MTTEVEDILQEEGVLSDKECVVCYTRFIVLDIDNYFEFLEKVRNKYNLPKPTRDIGCKLEDRISGQLYINRFECVQCKSCMCNNCLYTIPDNKRGVVLDGYAMFCNDYTEDEYQTLSMGESGFATCPVCRNEQEHDIG